MRLLVRIVNIIVQGVEGMAGNLRILYDRFNKRLVFIGRPADELYWDEHWENVVDSKAIRRPDRFVVRITKRFLPKGAKVVDAGCGLARTVFGLHQAGFDAHGIDYAPKTVELVRRLVPELHLSVGDVRNLSNVPDGSFDGLWSLGVVEHFYEGFEDIAAETYRVVKEGGYAFVTVPTMNPLRKLKAFFGIYPSAPSEKLDGFYQFALPSNNVRAVFSNVGFSLVSTSPRGGFKGLKDEITLLRPLMQSFYDRKALPLRAIRAFMDYILAPLSAHTRLYIFKK